MVLNLDIWACVASHRASRSLSLSFCLTQLGLIIMDDVTVSCVTYSSTVQQSCRLNALRLRTSTLNHVRIKHILRARGGGLTRPVVVCMACLRLLWDTGSVYIVGQGICSVEFSFSRPMHTEAHACVFNFRITPKSIHSATNTTTPSCRILSRHGAGLLLRISNVEILTDIEQATIVDT